MKKETVGGKKSNALEVLRRRKCRLDSALTISVTGGAEGWNRRSGEWPRPTLTWASGYRVVATDAPSRNRGGVALFYRPLPLFPVEAVMEYGPNVLSFEVATGAQQWYIIGCYLAPDDARTIERVVTALGDQPRVTALLVSGGLNTD